MKSTLSVILLLLPLSLAAQEAVTSVTGNQTAAASLTQVNVSSRIDDGSSTQIGADNNIGSDPDSDDQQQAGAKSSQSVPPRGGTKPMIPGSMVGYIDDAVVQSQIRIRFDDAFDDQFPNRSEFFYAKCSCYRGLQTAIPPAYDPNAPGPGPGVPNAVNYQQLYLNAEYSPFRGFSAFVEVPIRWLQPQGFQAIPPFPGFSNQSGLSDVTAGLKFAAVASEDTYLTFQIMSYFPSGDSSKGLGTNHYSIQPSLLLYKGLSSRFTLEGEVGDWHPIGGSAGVPTAGSEGFAGDVFFYGVGPSYKLYRGNHVGISPVIELVGWHVLGGFQTQPVDLTGVFCTSGSEREFTLEERWYAHETVQGGADRHVAAAD